LRAKLLAQLPGAKCAIANTALAAWGLARFAEPPSPRHGHESGQPRLSRKSLGLPDESINSLPLAALGLNDRAITKLRRVGIRRVGELNRLPRAALTAGYGPEPLRKLEQALGHAPETIHFITLPPEWREIRHFAEPIFAPAHLQTALATLTETLCKNLEKSQRGATALTATFYCVDSRRPEITLHFATPCRDEFQITKLLHEKLTQIDPGFGVDAIALHATQTEPQLPQQITIDRPEKNISLPTNTLLNRLGPKKIWRVEQRQTHIPERTTIRRQINLPPVPWSKQTHPRPLKLLEKPDPIAAIAPVPDDPPAAFTWRGKSHRIRSATGPERIAREWWRHEHDSTRPEEEKIRDYYAVEDSNGAKFWLFRAGLTDGVAKIRWYLHGFF